MIFSCPIVCTLLHPLWFLLIFRLLIIAVYFQAVVCLQQQFWLIVFTDSMVNSWAVVSDHLSSKLN